MVFSGFSLKPPGDPAWKILMKTKREVSFVRETGNGDHRIIAFFSSVHGTAGGIKGADDLERAARDRLEKLIKNPEVKNLKLKRTPVTIDGGDGIELRGTLKTVAGGKPGRNDSAIRIYHVCVLHPNPERDEMVHMGYTQRLFKGEKGPDVEKEISAAVASFKFRDGEN
jgi:hypothetical protein